MRRIAVLLGAGASADAGVPLTTDLAALLVRDLQRSFGADYAVTDSMVKALNFVYSALIGYSGEDGGDPLGAVNVERMFSAIRLLRTRRTHEAAPFISGWKRSVDGLDAVADERQDRMGVVRGVDQAIGGRFPSDGDLLAQEIRRIAREAAGPGTGTTYARLEQALLIRVRKLLATYTDVSYLSPLMDLATDQDGGLTIGTLNYDRTVEEIAGARAVPVHTGVDQWEPGTDLEFPDRPGEVNLIKLHGSIDWVLEDRPVAGSHRFIDAQVVRRSPDLAEEAVPAIVIGDREKLENDGPTLALLHAFQVALSRADRLVVVGYSFGDAHINTALRDWINGDAERTLTVLDPGWPREDRSDSFRSRLTRDLALGPGRPRLHVVRTSTKAGLQRALQEHPRSFDGPPLLARACHEDDAVLVEVTNNGPALDEVVVTMTREGAGRPERQPLSIDPVSELERQASGRLTAESLGEHATIRFRILFETRDRENRFVSFSLGGYTAVEHVREHFGGGLATDIEFVDALPD